MEEDSTEEVSEQVEGTHAPSAMDAKIERLEKGQLQMLGMIADLVSRLDSMLQTSNPGMSRNPANQNLSNLVQEARVSEEGIPRKSNDRRQQRDNSDSQSIEATRFLEGLQRLSAEQQLPGWVRKALPDSQFRYRNEREDCLKGATMNFPKYDGTKDPVSWFSRCEKYFVLHKIREHSQGL